MMEKIKSNFAYVGCAILGLLNFILLAIPYISSYYSYDSESGAASSQARTAFRATRSWICGMVASRA